MTTGEIRDSSRTPGTAAASLAMLLAFVVAYVAAAFLGRLTTFGGTPFALIWPAAGVAVLWFLLRGARAVSLDSVLLVVTAFATNAVTGVSPEQSAVLALTNLIQTLVAVTLMRRWCPDLWGCGGRRPLDSPWATVRYVGALAIGMVAGLAVGWVGTLVVQNELTLTRAVLWFDRNFCGALAVTTLGLLGGQWLTSRPRRRLVTRGRTEWIEIAGATAVSAGIYALGFALESLPMAFPLLIATVWVGLRFATLLSVLHSLALGTLAVLLTLAGVGPFAELANEEISILLAQFFLVMLLVTGLLLATGRDERELLARGLATAEREAVYQAGVLDTVITSMAEGLAVVDDAGEILMVNPAASVALGFDPSDPPRHLDDLPDMFAEGERLPEGLRPSRRAFAGETVRNAQVAFQPAGQEGRVLSVSAAPLPRDTQHDRARAVLLIRDATHEHAQRQELAAFAGVVAHDLRNPLAAIDGWTELLDDAAADGELKPQVVQEFISRVRASSARMHGLILHLLAHATSRNRALSLDRLDLAEATKRIALGRDAADFVTVGSIPPVHGDRVLLDQVLENLIGNALKYVAAGVRPHVEINGQLVEPGMVRVCVADNGIGLPEGQHDLVFDEFHRVHTKGYEGTGLGLAIVRRIVTRHGGSVLARDNPTGGTVFEFTVPAAV